MLLNEMRESKVNGNLNPYPTKLIDLNLQQLEVVSRFHDPQPQVIENICLIWAQILANLDVYTHLSQLFICSTNKKDKYDNSRDQQEKG